MEKALFITINDLKNPKTGGSVCSARNLDLVSTYFETDVFIVESNKFEKIFSFFFLLFPPFSIKNYWALSKLIRTNKYNLIFFDTSLFGILIKHIAKKHKIKTISFFHNVEYDYLSVRFGKKTIKYPYLFLAFINEKLTLKYSTRTIALSTRDKLRLMELYGKTVQHIIPITLDTKVTKEHIVSEHKKNKTTIPNLLFVGSLNRSNYISAVWFIEQVMPHIENAVLLIVGKGFETKSDILTKHNVEVIGTVENLNEYYYKSSCVVSPIFEGAGMKVKIAEALMFGCTVFGTDEAFEGYEIQDETITIKCNNALDFASKINAFIIKAEKENYILKSRQLFDDLYSNQRATKDFSKIMGSLIKE